MRQAGTVSDVLTIGEVAGRSGVATSALRFYEAEGLVHSVRSSGGQRRYHRDVIRRVSFIRIAQAHARRWNIMKPAAHHPKSPEQKPLFAGNDFPERERSATDAS